MISAETEGTTGETIFLLDFLNEICVYFYFYWITSFGSVIKLKQHVVEKKNILGPFFINEIVTQTEVIGLPGILIKYHINIYSFIQHEYLDGSLMYFAFLICCMWKQRRPSNVATELRAMTIFQYIYMCRVFWYGVDEIRNGFQ